jgi:hypothetical protein
MSGISNYFLDLVADNLSNRSEFPSTIYIALVTVEPTMGSTGSDISEPPSGVGYARQAYTMSSSYWTAASSGTISNTSGISFASQAIGIWGTMVAWVACTANSGGNVLFWGTLDKPSYINSGAAVGLPAGSIEITVDPNSQTLVG